MAEVVKDLGKVTAYAYAKAAGYTGTEEEFQEIFDEFTEDAPGLIERLEDAVEAAEGAQSAAEYAVTEAQDAQVAAEAAQSAAETAAATFTTDTTLAVSGKAADAKVVGDKLTEQSEAIGTFLKENKPFNWRKLGTEASPLGWRKGYYSSGTYTSGNTYICTTGIFYVPSAETKYFKVTAPSGYAVGVGEYNSDGTYIKVYGNANATLDTATKEVTVYPENGYKYTFTVGRWTSGSSNYITTEFISTIVLTEYSITDISFTEDGVPADAGKTGSVLFREEITDDFTDVRKRNAIISSTSGNWISSNIGTYFIRLKDGAKEITVKANSSENAVLGLVTDFVTTPDTVPSYATGCTRERINAGTEKTFSIPSNALWATLIASEYTPSSVEIKYNKLTTFNDVKELTGITHLKPTSQGQLNVVRRCRQFTDIKWTPAVDIPRLSQLANDTGGANNAYFEDVFKAGVEYTGIPYGRAKRHATTWGADSTIGMKVGWTVGLETFVSAVMSEESVVAKDSVYDASDHNAPFYATICTALCGYAYALDTYYTTEQIASAPGMQLVANPVSNLSLDNLNLGDMLLSSSHGGIVTDIIFEGGTVTAVEVSEATTIGNDDWNTQGSQFGGVCRRRTWLAEEFMHKWGDYKVYHYAYIADVPYVKSPYVDTGDEGDTLRVVNFPCLPYMGEGFKYIAGSIGNTKILTPAYRADSLNKLRVIKDGENWNYDGTTNYYDVSGAYVEVGFSAAGEYSAYLCQVSNGSEVLKTRSCHWTVVST